MNIELKVTLWALASAYALGNSFIYSWTFWTAFDINILQFASITDIIPSIIYNLILPFAILVLSVIVAEIWVRLKENIGKIIDNYLSPYLKNYEKIKLYARILATVTLVIVALIAVIYNNKLPSDLSSTSKFPWLEFSKLIMFVTLTFIIIHFIIFKSSFLSDFRYRMLIIICIGFAPTASYVWAIKNSHAIINGIDTFIVKSDSQCKSSPDTQLRYISSISDKAFALSLKDGSICIFKYNTLELIHESKKNFTVALDSKVL